ncbi:hypothetical protein L2E82_15377 [Cichorium intybus]|uniref:Uncharacterized protein n=1 Tax=Cichorium intybus TaxID=13427 RepID=A0ACB9F332_CICIN|nr:hypothetical protein L2E82_15377 [Cichorium intybus]
MTKGSMTSRNNLTPKPPINVQKNVGIKSSIKDTHGSQKTVRNLVILMEMDPGKLFIGGISWDTTEDRLREYFQTFGEVIEAVIMKDRTTGRARGFGFIVFSDPTISERVVKEKHVIDGRTVEAKKAVPRDDQQGLTRINNGSLQNSPGPTRTKKIFVGGLASTVTEIDFKNYFDQFGTTTDVVVMYDHNTQRPRGFGFITYESEESVEKVLLRTFHELNGKMVEVKRAVPKESSPGPNRSNLTGYNNNNKVSGYFNPSLVGGYGRFSPVTVGQTGYSRFGPDFDSVLGLNYGGNGNFSPNLGYGRAPSPVYNLTPNRFSGGSGGGGGGSGGDGSILNSMNHDMWGNGSEIYTNNSSNSNGFGGYGAIWGNPISGNGGNGGGSGFTGGGFSFSGGGNGVNAIGYGRNNGGGNSIVPASSYSDIGGGGGGGGGGGSGGVGGDSFYGDSTWRSSSPDLDVPGLFNYGFGSGGSDGLQKKSVGYVGYSVANRSNRGIAA